MRIQSYLQAKLDTGDYKQQYRLGMELKISSSMLSHYLTGRTKQPSLDLAIQIYKDEKIILWPYSLFSVSEGKEGEE